MKRLLVVAALAALMACEGSGEGDAPACFSIQDCEEDRTCFFGRCVEAGYGVATVYAEMTPPNDSPWLEQQVPYPLDLLDGFQDIPLRASVPFSGRLIPDSRGTSLPGLLLVRATDSGVPGRDILRQANVTETGFELEVIPGRMELSFEPSDETKPPKNYWVDIHQARDQELPYPTDAELIAHTFSGRVLQQASEQSISSGARVAGNADNPDHPETPFRSTVATTDENGEFAITFLPEAAGYAVRVGPNPGINETIPEVLFEIDTPVGNDFGDLVLGIDFEQDVTVGVIDENGNPVRDANVLFEGEVGDEAGRFVVSSSSDDRGDASARLLPGDYTVTVAPQKSQPYALVSEVATIPNGDLTVTVRHKIRLNGCVTEHDTSTRVADAEITLSRLDSPIARVFRTSTNSDGCYEVLVDPGTVNANDEFQAAEYELTVQPSAETGLPFYRELMYVWEDPFTHDIQLYEPELVYGMVRDPNGMPLENVIIAFYSTELGLPDEPVLVGVVSTLDGIRAGEFVLPVPVPPREE